MDGNTPNRMYDKGSNISVQLTPKAWRWTFAVSGRFPKVKLISKAGAKSPAKGGQVTKLVLKLSGCGISMRTSAIRMGFGAQTRQKSIQLAGEPAPL